jgi:RNA polymerase sigma-70 factor (ECF subfamily)
MAFDEAHLSQIETLWSVMRRAHGDGQTLAVSAQQQLLERYGGAAKRYLRAVVKDGDAAEDLYQDFAVKFLRGDFASAAPDRGRFRAFLKTTLFRMAMDHHRRRQRGPQRQEWDSAIQPTSPEEERESDVQFAMSWREELLARAWASLAACEAETGQPFHTTLELRVAAPDLHSPELAQRLSEKLGREISAANVRVILHRAREKFADLLLDEVVHSLDQPTMDELEEELCELRLLEYCKPALEARA